MKKIMHVFYSISLAISVVNLNTKSKKRNRVRIIGGVWRSRLIEFPDREGLRPTSDRIRETLFNWLGQSLHGKYCLDLFSGSGALGLEAASRGAAHVTLVESAPQTIDALNLNLERLEAHTCQLIHSDALNFLARDNKAYDVVFVDPPFASNFLEPVLCALRTKISPAGLAYVEWGSAIDTLPEVLSHWCVVKQGRAGQVHFALLSRSLHSTG